MEGDALVDGMNGIAVAQAFRDSVGAFSDACLLHDSHHAPPGGSAGPDPQGLIEFAASAPALDFAEAVHHVERVQQDGRYRYGTVDTLAAFFEAFNDDDLVSKIHPSGGHVEGFGETAAGIIQDAAKSAHVPVVLHGGGQEGVALGGCEVKAPTEGIVEWGRGIHHATGYKDSVTIASPRILKRPTQGMVGTRLCTGLREPVTPWASPYLCIAQAYGDRQN